MINKTIPILSICIPTYNRPDELNNLLNNFILPAIQAYGMELEFIVCDNSDAALASINKKNVSHKVSYHWNENNIGFAKNVLKCTGLARGKYIWLLPDNDQIVFTAFCELVKSLQERDADCILVPFKYRDMFNREFSQKYDFIDSQNSILSDLFNHQAFIPFTLLSSAVVRRGGWEMPSTIFEFSENTFVQIPLLLSMLTARSRIYVLKSVVINYNVEYMGRFNPLKSFQDISLVFHYISKHFTFNSSSAIQLEYRQLLWNIISDSTGVYSIYQADIVRWRALGMLRHFFDIKTFVIWCILLMPKWVRANLWMGYVSFNYHGKKVGYFRRLMDMPVYWMRIRSVAKADKNCK